MDNDMARQVAIHEAAHLLYAARAGAIKVIFHAAQEREGRKYEALIEPTYTTDPATNRNLNLLDTAKFLVSGGVAARLLGADTSGGDGQDLANFVGTVQTIPEFNPDLAVPMWEAVKTIVEKELSSPDVYPLLQTLADKVHLKLEQAKHTPTLRVMTSVSEFEEIPILLQLLDRNSKPE
jgi:hypothetical protein